MRRKKKASKKRSKRRKASEVDTSEADYSAEEEKVVGPRPKPRIMKKVSQVISRINTYLQLLQGFNCH